MSLTCEDEAHNTLDNVTSIATLIERFKESFKQVNAIRQLSYLDETSTVAEQDQGPFVEQ